MPVRKRRERGRDAAGVPGQNWLLTYSDMVTLLLTFFVLLFTFSNLDVQRFRSIVVSLQSSLGVLDGGRTIRPAPAVFDGPLDQQPFLDGLDEANLQLRQIMAELEEFVATHRLEEAVSLVLEERGVVVRFADQVFFDLGRAELKPEARRILDLLVRILLRWPNPIRVEGHTDNWPIRTQRFPSNWELSTTRATTVVRYLIERHGLDPQRLSAAGYGEFRPLVPNDTAEQRARNRRVDLVLLRQDLGAGEPR